MSGPDIVMIRRPVLSGYQPIEALWFPAERFSEHERARLILSHWQTDAKAYRFADGDLLRFPKACARLCEGLAGWPLIRQGRTLCSARLSNEEMQHLAPADVWLVRGTQVSALHLREATALAPGQWIDVSQYALLATYDCRDALPEPHAEPLVVQTDIREILGDSLAPVSPEREGVMRALLERQRQAAVDKATAAHRPPASASHSQGRGPLKDGLPGFIGVAVGTGIFAINALNGTRSPTTAPPAETVKPPRAVDPSGFDLDNALAWALIGTVFFVLFMLALMAGRAWVRRDGVRTTTGKATHVADAARPVQPSVPPRASGRPRGPARWRRWLTQLTRHSRLSALYGKRQAAYMQRMLDMFENGNLEEALRHAIPLGGGQGDAGQAFGTPTRRQDLTLSQHSAPGTRLLFEADLESHLKQVYRQSFERLDREGRIEEAVFVLAELLRARQEALDYLEKHQRHQQAADLALAWDMSASTIVRLLCLAGDWQRALQVARRDNAFADAVILLEKKWPEAAARLRLEWALALTEKGLWLQAVDVIWSLPAERERAAQWLLAAEAAGGSLAIGALVKRAILLPDTLTAYETWVETLRSDPARVMERATLAQALLAHKAYSPALAWLAAATVRAIICDQAGPQAHLTQNQLQALVKMSKDKLLQADLPGNGLPRNKRLNQGLERVSDPLSFTAPDRGVRAICDAVPLTDGRYLLALGEAGASVVEANGKCAFHFPVPTQVIVLGHSRQVALALARRGDVWRICKLDLVNRSASDLGVLMLDAFARTFDGTAWTVGRGTQLRVVDVGRRLETLWHVGDLPGQITSIRDDEHNESVFLQTPQQALLWHYRLPERRLLRREPLPVRRRAHSWQVFDAVGRTVELWIEDGVDDDPALMVYEGVTSKRYRLPGFNTESADPLHVYPFAQWLVIGFRVGEDEARWHFIHRSSDRLCAVMDWPLEHAQLRFVGSECVLFDHQGRLWQIDVARSTTAALSVQ
ncbi:bpX6 domain-containing protein [Pseudomonas sp. MS646]|uniref:bpX6 domain-containing protein n=1 Tax=Pseudomonas sp. MS646 TaxID=3118751 RepID=UPI0030D052D7